MKLCKDCVYCKLAEPVEHSRCLHPVTTSRKSSPIDGIERVFYLAGKELGRFDFPSFAESVRGDLGFCGPDATLFEPIQIAEAA